MLAGGGAAKAGRSAPGETRPTGQRRDVGVRAVRLELRNGVRVQLLNSISSTPPYTLGMRRLLLIQRLTEP
jgi:hypothetical protein